MIRSFCRRRARNFRVQHHGGRRFLKTAPEKGDKVVIAMSGGVDSSVAALKLSEKDYDLSAIYMKNWDTRDESGSDIGCEWEKDWEDVQRVCKILGIPCGLVDFSTIYWTNVFEPALNDWQGGYLTPNPDVWCNREIKFGALAKRVFSSDENTWLATGHYATISRSENGRPRLFRARDRRKDQTYFLSCIHENALSRTLFPLSHLLKSEVRGIAQRCGLPTANREESMGLCFVGERRKFNDFLSSYLVSKPGEIIDLNGKVIGRHAGLWRYTIGQGAKIPGLPERTFVAQKDSKNNRLIVVSGQHHPSLFTSGIMINNWHWIWCDFKIPNPPRFRVQIRHLMLDVPCTVVVNQKGYIMKIIFDDPQKGVAPGQIAVLWDNDWCLGCGTIAGLKGVKRQCQSTRLREIAELQIHFVGTDVTCQESSAVPVHFH